MAAIGKIRSWGPALVGILALGLVGFIAQDGFSTCRGQAQMNSSTAGSIGGDKVDIQEFSTLVGEYQELLKLQGRDNLDEEQLNGLRDYIWQNCINNKIIETEAKKLGLTVTDEELVQIIQDGTHPALMQTPLIAEFVDRQTGKFDVTKVNSYREYMKNQAANNAQIQVQYELFERCWPRAEKMLAQKVLETKYTALLAGCILSNPISAKASFDNQNVETDVVVASLPYRDVNDNDVEVSDADIKAKYEEVKERFKTYEEYRDIKYVTYKVVASQKDRDDLMAIMQKASADFKDSVAISDILRTTKSSVPYLGLPVTRESLPTDLADSITKMSVGQVTAPFESRDNTYNVVKFLGKVTVPDSIEFRVISVPGSTPAALASVDSIVKALNAGAVFDSIAKNYGQRAEKAWFRSNYYESASTLTPDDKLYFSKLMYSPVNAINKIQFSEGNIILQVTDHRGSVEKYDVAIVKRSIDFSPETATEAYNKFCQFVSESNNVDGLEAKAAEYGYVVRDLSRTNADHNLANIPPTHEALRWLFSDAKEGDLSQVFDRCGNNDQMLVVGLSAINPVGYRSQKSLEELLKQEVLNDKKFAKLSEQLKDVKSIAEAEAKGAKKDTLTHTTFASPTFVPSVSMPEIALSGAVAGTEKGVFSKAPVKGNAAAYVFQVLNRSSREGVQFDAAAVQERLRQQYMQQTLSTAITELINKMEVKDNRYLFF